MAEVAFAKSFLAALDARPSKLSPDHVEDPRRFPDRTAYTLSRQTKPMRRPADRTATTTTDPSSSTPTTTTTTSSAAAPPGQERSFTVVIRSLRGGDPVRLTSQAPDTAVLDLRRAAAAALVAGGAADRVRLLFRKKPVPDHRVLRELAGDPDDHPPSEENRTGTVEFSLMLMGGGGGGGGGSGASTPKPAPAEQQQREEDVLQTPAFWDDLRGFLLQRVRDEKLATDMADEFRAAWVAKNKKT